MFNNKFKETLHITVFDTEKSTGLKQMLVNSRNYNETRPI